MKRRKIVKAIFKFAENVDTLITDVRAFYKAITTPPGNTLVTIPAPDMVTAQLDLTGLNEAQVDVKKGTHGAAATRDGKGATVVTEVRDFVRIVQKAADAAVDAITAKTIVTNCGLVTQEETPKVKPEFEVRNHKGVEGVLDFISKAADRKLKATYEHEQSTDNVVFTPAKISQSSRTTFIHGKPPGTKMYYRRRIILSDKKGGPQTWSQSFWLYVI